MRWLVRFRVPGAAVGKGRPRATRTGRVYTPAATVAYERQVSNIAGLAYGGEAFAGAVSVSITIIQSPPASWSKRKTEDALSGKIAPFNRVDVDNVAKIVLDAIQGADGVFVDDKQVVDLRVCRIWGVEPAVSVQVLAHDDLVAP